MRKNYVKPALISEEFLAEICATACFTIACTKGINGETERVNGNKTLYHTKGGCGTASHQHIQVTNGEHITEIFEEAHKEGYGFDGGTAVDGSISVSDNYPNTLQNETVTWKTVGTSSYDKGYEYSHSGIIQLIDTMRPNHS